MYSQARTTGTRERAIRWLLARLLLLAVMLSPCQPARVSAADYVEAEYNLKAAFLYNFARFTDWPKHAGETFRLCLLGENRLTGAMQSLAGRTVNNAPLEIIHQDGLAGIVDCDLVYIDASYRENLADVLTVIAQHAILTVSDIDEFIDYGGIIGLRIIDNKLRFEINVAAASRAGLSISSRLLTLASRVSLDR